MLVRKIGIKRHRSHQSDRKTELLKTNLGQNSLGAETFSIWLLVKVLTAFKSQQSPMWLSVDRGGVCEWPFWGWHTGWLLSVPLEYGHLARPGDLEDNWAFSRRCELSLLGLHLLHESYSDFMSLSVVFFPLTCTSGSYTDLGHLMSCVH